MFDSSSVAHPISPSPDDADPRRLLDPLQESMEEIALGQKANQGRFCGYCYAPLTALGRRKGGGPPAEECARCGARTDRIPAVGQVPPEVLAIYLSKRRREGLFVNLFAFVGIFVSLVLSAALWFLLPDNWWRLAPFAMLAFGSYYLARVIGYNVGVPLGSNSGCELRDRRWRAFVQAREAGK